MNYTDQQHIYSGGQGTGGDDDQKAKPVPKKASADS